MLECDYCCAVFNNEECLSCHVKKIHTNLKGEIINIVDKTKLNTINDRKILLKSVLDEKIKNKYLIGLEFESNFYKFDSNSFNNYIVIKNILVNDEDSIIIGTIDNQNIEMNKIEFNLFFQNISSQYLTFNNQIVLFQNSIINANSHDTLNQIENNIYNF